MLVSKFYDLSFYGHRTLVIYDLIRKNKNILKFLEFELVIFGKMYMVRGTIRLWLHREICFTYWIITVTS